MIKTKNIYFSYGNTQTLSDVSLEFSLGKMYGIIGPNGSGKSTLLKLLANQLKLNKGEILIDETSIQNYTRVNFAKKIWYMSQHMSKYQITVKDFVSFGRFPHLTLSKKLTEQDFEIVTKKLHVTNTEHLSDKLVCNLSGGEQRRALIAMVLTQDTPYILLDEPTSSLDISSKFEFFEKFKSLSESGRCVVTVVHDISMALRFCDTIILLNDGKVISVDSPREIVKSGDINKIFNVTCKQITIDDENDFIIRRQK